MPHGTPQLPLGLLLAILASTEQDDSFDPMDFLGNQDFKPMPQEGVDEVRTTARKLISLAENGQVMDVVLLARIRQPADTPCSGCGELHRNPFGPDGTRMEVLSMGVPVNTIAMMAAASRALTAQATGG